MATSTNTALTALISVKLKPARAIQLVHTDESGQLQLNESAVQTCFLDGEISDYPVCLICVIGEKRRGKSFLMNYILRALSCQEQAQPLSLGADDDPLSGFEWRDGIESTTKGIWIWSKPFILENNGEKMAVFVLDTEGSLDIQSSRDICLKLSALSMILSSYLIFNVNSNLKTTDLDYLEMYLDVAENVGKSFDLQSLQHLNILIRDWHDFKRCGNKDAWEYLIHETEKLQKEPQFKSVSETLRGPLADCSLLPHPGRGLLVDSQGKLSDMKVDFRNLLTTYIFTLVGNLWLYRKTNRQEEKVTCAQLASILKRGVNILQSTQHHFASPLQMFFTFENHKNMEKTKNQFQKYINRMSNEADFLRSRWNVNPFQMESSIKYMATKFLRDFKESFQGVDAQEKERLVNELQYFLLKQQQHFCKDYSKSFYGFQNHKRMRNIKEKFLTQITLKEYEKFSLIKKGRHPIRIQNKLRNEVNKLLNNYKESLEGIDEERELLLLSEMESDLSQEIEKFCKMYRKIFDAWKRMEDSKKKIKKLLDQIKEESSSSLWNLMNTPSVMQSKIKEPINIHLLDFINSLEGIDSEDQTIIKEELISHLMEMENEFCKQYSSDYRSTIEWIKRVAPVGAYGLFAFKEIIKNKTVAAAIKFGGVMLPGVIGVVVIGSTILTLRRMYANKSTQY
ncbi:RING finger protein 112 [Xenopus laevis]|uniref:RING finger protein 112 n=1 Tax=Xenopus laevis TaxID=8355 RepID=A0A8J0TYE9_XENLA|nr:RING finger protein 112 [Xenopus laevis]